MTGVWVGCMCLRKDSIEYETGRCQRVGASSEINIVSLLSTCFIYNNKNVYSGIKRK